MGLVAGFEWRGYTGFLGDRMAPEEITQLVSQLSPEEQSAVRDFIAFLKERGRKVPATMFLTAVDEFIATHPELLRRLAQ
jgi:hypothetical protein